MSLEVYEEKLFSGGDDSIVRIWNTNNWFEHAFIVVAVVVLVVLV